VVNRGIEEWVCIGHYLEKPLVSPSEPGQTKNEGGNSEARNVIKRAKGGDGGTGIVIMDMVGENGDWDLVRMIVGMNMGVLLRMADAESYS
jgi:1-phosphatidylinositol phosphodiesterase